ncbi:MAG: stage III sporulation protein AE [Defluviitaleaceae bacterium]|nr:stage III sporulation protein AE [Defluviitaleaceae bacterium]MCL2264067.1 stage III sporulation protein AE [Defluviitaleaceae bacterium]
MNGAVDYVEEVIGLIGLERYDIGILDRPGMPRFSDLVRDALTGQINLTPNGIFSAFGEFVFAELLANGNIIRQLVVIAVLGALMSCLTEAFKHKSAGETGFYVTYLMAVLLAVSSFYISVEILNGLVSLVSAIMLASIPLMIGLMVMGGNFVGAAGFHPMLYFAFQLVAWFISAVFIPIVFVSAALDITGQISPDGHKLGKMAALLRQIGNWALKGILATFAFLLTLQRFSAPIISNATIRTSRSVAGAVPVVGNALTAAVDTVVNFSQAARSGVLIALVLVLCFVIAAPLLKMFVISLVYRIAAAFLQPIADPRLVSLMDGIGKHMAMLFNAAALIGIMCVYVVIILLSF